MYACIHESWAGFFERVCTLSATTANLRDPPPSPQNERTGALAVGLRPEVDHASRCRGGRFSLG